MATSPRRHMAARAPGTTSGRRETKSRPDLRAGQELRPATTPPFSRMGEIIKTHGTHWDFADRG